MENTKENMLQLDGYVDQIIFRNDSNGYTVLNIISGEESITAVGVIPFINVGENLKLLGNYKSHPNFGMQFSVEACQRSMPDNIDGILRYLSSGSIKGIGPVTASKLVEKFGDQTLEVFEKYPERLSEIKGITRAKAKKMSEEFRNIFGIKEIMLYLANFGIEPFEAISIWKSLGGECLEIIKENPYIICSDPVNINFERADEIAASLEKAQDSDLRIKAGIIYVLNHNMRNGHTCLPMDKLIEATAKFLDVNPEKVKEILEEMKNCSQIDINDVEERRFAFLPKMYMNENYIANRLSLMIKYPPKRITGIDRDIEYIEKKHSIEYADLQKKAIIEALATGILILTGGPGTGKTTTLNAIISILKLKGEKVYLAAPTGRAAQRMSEVTGEESKTIHRILEVGWDQQDKLIFRKNESNLLDCDALILDELSMVDTILFEGVLKALPLGCRLIMVGDSDQLPSVGPGNVLGEMIKSNIIPVVELNEIFRQSMESLIVTNAHKIVKGEFPELYVRNNDFFFIDDDYMESISEKVVDLCTRRLPSAYGYSPLFDIQVLSPGRKGKLGTFELNKQLQETLNPPDKSKHEIKINGFLMREGDKIMQTKNNYEIQWTRDDGNMGEGIFNGDVGTILEIDRASSNIVVKFDDKTALYDIDNATDLELAYAITIHKSQGSEFEAVVMPMYPGAKQLYYRNLLYTGVTRAKSMIVMVGKRQTVKMMVDNDRKTKRFSGLGCFLKTEEI